MSTTAPRYLSDITDDETAKAALDAYEDACASVAGLLEELERQRQRRDRHKAVAEAAIRAHNERVAEAVRGTGSRDEVSYEGAQYPVTQTGRARYRVAASVWMRGGEGKGLPGEAMGHAARAALKAEGYVLMPDGRDK